MKHMTRQEFVAAIRRSEPFIIVVIIPSIIFLIFFALEILF